jgi:hypothetical protein
MLLLAACGRSESPVSAHPTATPGFGEDVSDRLGPALITDADSGKTFIYPIAGEFSFELDAARHPVADLDRTECPNVQPLKRLAPNGPKEYPIGFLVNRRGSCTVRNGDFFVKIDVCVQATSPTKSVCRVTGYNEEP